jgi:hypothetical protein
VVLEVHVSGGALAGLRAGGHAVTAGGQPAGVDPAERSRVAEAKTMAVVQELRSSKATQMDVTRLRRTRLPGLVQPALDAGESSQAESGIRDEAAVGSNR